MLERLNTLWFGDRLDYMERLSINSALALGHPYTLYSYQPDKLKGVPAAVELRDASEIMPRDLFASYSENGWAALGSDFFRYALLDKGLGYWVDLDCYFVKPLAFKEPYVFGWERPDSINGAVLKIPTGSPMMKELRSFPIKNWCPPFFGPRRKAIFYWMRLRKGEVKPGDLPWGAFGPALITYEAKKHGAAKQAKPIEVFYPISYADAQIIFEKAELAQSKITPETHVVHFWHSRLGDLVRRPPAKNSYLDVLCNSFGV